MASIVPRRGAILNAHASLIIDWPLRLPLMGAQTMSR